MKDEDIPAILRIENAVFSHPWPESAFDSTQFKDSFVLELNGSVIGYIMGMVVMDECSIINIAIDPDHQRQGYGYLLFMKFIEMMTPRGVQVYYLDVRESNVSAQRLYEKLGFRRIALRKSYYSDPEENAVVMCYEIDKH